MMDFVQPQPPAQRSVASISWGDVGGFFDPRDASGFLGGIFEGSAEKQRREAERLRNQLAIPGFEDLAGRQQALGEQLLNRGTPQFGPSALAGGSQYAGQQQELLGQLGADARGEGLVQQQVQRNLQDAFGRAVNAQQAAAVSGRGNPALRQLQAAQAAADVQSGLAGQGAALGLQGQLAAQQQLGGALQGFGNLELQRQLGMDQYGLGVGSLQEQALGRQQQGALTAQQLEAALRQAQAQQYGQAESIGAGIAGMPTTADKVLNVGSTLGGFALLASDKRLKKNVKDAGDDIDEFIASIKPKKFRFKDERHGEGEHLGFMAQDLERSKAGKEMVVDTPAGKHVNLQKLSTALAAALARQSKRLDELEGK